MKKTLAALLLLLVSAGACKPSEPAYKVGAIVNYGQQTSAVSGPLSWWAQRREHAKKVLNQNGNVQVDYSIDFDYSRTAPVLTASPAIDSTLTGTVYNLNGANSQVNDLPVSGAKLIASPNTEAWYVAKRVSFASGSVAANYCTPLGMENGTSYVDITILTSDSTTHLVVIMAVAGSALSPDIDLGASFALGSLNVPTPSVPVTIGMYHTIQPLTVTDAAGVTTSIPGGSLVEEVNDIVAGVQTASAGGLDKFPTAPLALLSACNNATTAMRVFGGFAMLQTQN